MSSKIATVTPARSHFELGLANIHFFLDENERTPSARVNSSLANVILNLQIYQQLILVNRNVYNNVHSVCIYHNV